jgi:hypothetical protein
METPIQTCHLRQAATSEHHSNGSRNVVLKDAERISQRETDRNLQGVHAAIKGFTCPGKPVDTAIMFILISSLNFEGERI